jgi:hypothetical protein
MSKRDWSRVADAKEDTSQEITLRIDLLVTEGDAAPDLLTEVAKTARSLMRSGKDGVWEAQWCDCSARISIARAS